MKLRARVEETNMAPTTTREAIVGHHGTMRMVLEAERIILQLLHDPLGARNVSQTVNV